MIPVLESERLCLREWRESDFRAFAAFAMDPVAAHYITPAASEGEAWRKMVCYIGHWQLRGYGLWSVEERTSGLPIGYCGPYFPIDWPEPEIGWGIYPAHQNKGYATEAARTALDYAYSRLGWTTAISLIADGNRASVRVAEKLGAVAEYQIAVQGCPCTIYRHQQPQSFRLHSKEKATWQ